MKTMIRNLSMGGVAMAMMAGVGVATSDAAEWDEYLRNRMVEEQIVRRGVKDVRVLEAMRRIPRHAFVPAEFQRQAYSDRPLPIDLEQTISQPYIVALMTEAARVAPSDRVLEIGTGSGYQAAVLAELAARVYTIELLEPLAAQARVRLRQLGYDNVEVRHGDGYAGWPEAAPFDVILVTAAPPEAPQALLDQLAPGGRMVAPVGTVAQELYRFTKTDAGIRKERLLSVRFVPMVPSEE